MFHKVKAVKPIDKYMLAVQFVNGEKKHYDISTLFEKWESFKTLEKVSGLFEQVKVDAGGYGISWNDDLDVSCDELYYKGTL